MRLTRADPERKMRRFYIVDVMPTRRMVAAAGMGSPRLSGSVRHESFEQLHEAQAAEQRIVSSASGASR
jgi:predicted DNA-binding WGR domain protein